jgi:hypothetical protein
MVMKTDPLERLSDAIGEAEFLVKRGGDMSSCGAAFHNIRRLLDEARTDRDSRKDQASVPTSA